MKKDKAKAWERLQELLQITEANGYTFGEARVAKMSAKHLATRRGFCYNEEKKCYEQNYTRFQPHPRKYKSNAERQAAYRKRCAVTTKT
jgi:hypothetical protein